MPMVSNLKLNVCVSVYVLLLLTCVGLWSVIVAFPGHIRLFSNKMYNIDDFTVQSYLLEL